MSYPSYDLLFKDFEYLKICWNGISEQINNPFKFIKYDPITHNSNTCFRISVPLFAHLLGLGESDIFTQVIFLLILQLIMLFVLIITVYKIFIRITLNPIISSLLILSFSLTYAANSIPFDIWGNLDIFAYAFIAIAIYSRNSLVIFLAVLFSSFSDERALVCSSLVFIFHAIDSNGTFSFYLRNFRWNSRLTAIIASWVAYFSIRFILSYYLGFETNTYTAKIWLTVIKENVSNLPFGFWSGLEGFWLIIGLSFILLLHKRSFLLFFIFAGCITISSVVAFSVLDITRSIAFIFPAIFISLLIIYDKKEEKKFFHLFLVVLALCLFPTYFVGGHNVSHCLFPFPFQLLRMVFEAETFSVRF